MRKRIHIYCLMDCGISCFVFFVRGTTCLKYIQNLQIINEIDVDELDSVHAIINLATY